jgi:saccharopine dehydrogenase (NAD+, L-lysine-forming)
VSAQWTDINDTKQLVETLKGYDVVINCVVPFYRNGAKVLEACITSRVNYVEICDDYDAADLLLGSTEKCKEAGITAIVCQGASKMDPEEIHTAWVKSVSDAGGFVV